ncbi:MAG: gluconate 2-dehydrogenase subunit 3 family protein [Saprospiraceae bacterium]|nr:gluconate 2-dehydrogenase subunit 3 family protein [Saprospiraceae bacterium]
MDRRSSLKKFMILSGGLVSLPAWANGWKLQDVSSGGSHFLEGQEDLLASLVDTILPPGEDGVGGIKVGVDQFLIKLFDRCYEVEVQENIQTRMKSLHEKAEMMFGRSFKDCDQLQRQELLTACANSENESEKNFFELIKSESIRGFRTSREVMIKYYKYRVAPGFYHGCVDVEMG